MTTTPTDREKKYDVRLRGADREGLLGVTLALLVITAAVWPEWTGQQAGKLVRAFMAELEAKE